MQRLLVSVRGKKEALEAAEGGAHIADVEYPASALGTPYPLNIQAVRRAVPPSVAVSTNIGEEQLKRSTACQAAVGVAVAGADIVKAGLAKLTRREATYLARSIVRSIKAFAGPRGVILAFFADPELAQSYVDPLADAIDISNASGANGVLVDTFDKTLGKGLLDYVSVRDLARFVKDCHHAGLEAWLAGSIKLDQLSALWKTSADVICVRQAACEPGNQAERFGRVTARRVRKLAATVP